MVKFSKELEARLIPEWKDAFINYWKLKKNVKRIKLCQSKRKITGFSNYMLLTRDFIQRTMQTITSKFLNDSDESKVVQVKGYVCDDAKYEMELLQIFSGSKIQEFFELLDEELHKVNEFYKSKEIEFVKLGETLKKQLQILMEMKRFLHCHHPGYLSCGSTIKCNSTSIKGSQILGTKGNIDGIPQYVTPVDDIIMVVEKGKVLSGLLQSTMRKWKPNVFNDIGKSRTSLSDKREGTTANTKHEISEEFVSPRKIQCAEKMIRSGFLELYRVLGLLKAYRSLNMIAFRKILKKFDKVVNQKTSRTYMEVMMNSYFICSNKAINLTDEVEHIFTQHFTNNDRKKAMKYLRPHQHTESHFLTFLLGIFTGCFVTLFSVYIVLANITNLFSSTMEVGYVETICPIFSVFSLLSLHLFVYGCNLFIWRSTRINHIFIFNFSASSVVNYKDVFLICTSLMTMVVGALVIHLFLGVNGFSGHNVDAIPGFAFLFFLCLLICPFDIVYRSSRYCFLRVIRNIMLSPLYRVVMVDFFMADQLTSQIPLLRHLEFTICYLLAENFKTHNHRTCTSSKLFRQSAYVISFMPYYWRAMQCSRRWFDEGDINHVANLGKYISGMVAAGARLTYAIQPSPLWLVTVVVTSFVATVYQLYWDFVKDWGLLNPKSKNPYLRDELILKHNSVYYVSIVRNYLFPANPQFTSARLRTKAEAKITNLQGLNFVLRLAWLQSVMHLNLGRLQYQLFDFSLASLEIIRRGLWNFFRLENEHVNNVGKFRAAKTVPLPFPGMDSSE